MRQIFGHKHEHVLPPEPEPEMDVALRQLTELEHICTALQPLSLLLQQLLVALQNQGEAITLLRFRLERIDGHLEGLDRWLSEHTDYEPARATLERAGQPRDGQVP